MQRYFALSVLILSFVLLAPLTHAVQPDARSLQVGDVFPQFTGKTLTGKPLEIPTVVAGKPAVVIFSFTKRAGKDAQLWNEHIAKDFSINVPCYTVIMLESVPILFRGMVVSGIRSNMPPVIQGLTIVSYLDEALWRHRLTVTDDSHAYVVLVGTNGDIRWMNSRAFSNAEYRSLNGKTHEQL